MKVIAKFLVAIYITILKYLLIAGFQGNGLLKLVLTNFGIVKINVWGILYLHYFV